MNDRAHKIEDLRQDMATLRTLIDDALDGGAGRNDVVLRACAEVFSERRTRLDELESKTFKLYVSKGEPDPPSEQ
jgi:hypothetical protein